MRERGAKQWVRQEAEARCGRCAVERARSARALSPRSATPPMVPRIARPLRGGLDSRVANCVPADAQAEGEARWRKGNSR